jgi:hypothetical protein
VYLLLVCNRFWLTAAPCLSVSLELPSWRPAAHNFNPLFPDCLLQFNYCCNKFIAKSFSMHLSLFSCHS